MTANQLPLTYACILLPECKPKQLMSYLRIDLLLYSMQSRAGGGWGAVRGGGLWVVARRHGLVTGPFCCDAGTLPSLATVQLQGLWLADLCLLLCLRLLFCLSFFFCLRFLFCTYFGWLVGVSSPVSH